MTNLQINRYEWLKAVLQVDGLNTTAKALASALAIKFASDSTGQINPSTTTLARYLKLSLPTAKRAVAALVAAGWLARTEGRGTGNRLFYTLTSPGKVVSFAKEKPTKMTSEKGADLPPISGSNMSLSDQKHGSNTSFHRLKNEPSYIEQSLEQKGPAFELARLWVFSGRNTPGPLLIAQTKTNTLEAWGRWIKKEGFGSLSLIPLKRTGSKLAYFALPYSEPPSTENEANEARQYFSELLALSGARYAAQ